MKVVKLKKSHHLFQYGYTVALRFSSPYSPGAQACKSVLCESYGIDYTKWHTFRSGKNRPYWIGLTDEKLMTFLLLKVDLTK